MKTYLLITLLLSVVFSISAQKYDKAIVTDVHCYRQENSEFGSENELPYYFQHQAFIDDIQKDIKKHLKEKYNIDSIHFLHSGKIKTTSAYVAPNLMSKSYALEHGDNNALYLEVLTKLNVRVVNNGVPRYGFSTKIKAYNSKGKQVYKFTNVIPFEWYKEGGITGPAVIGEEDFYNFYFDGLTNAFIGKVKKTELRYVRKPLTNFYDDYIGEAEEFVYLPVKNGFAYGNTIELAKDVLSFDENFWHSMNNEFSFDNVFKDHNFKEAYNLTNNFNKEKYLVKLKGDVNTFFDFLSLSSNVAVEFRNSRKEIIGEFELHSIDTLRGNLNNNIYTVVYNSPYGCSEFYNDDNLIALMNHLGGHDVVYVHQSATAKHLGDLFNLFFAWQYSVALQMIIDKDDEID